MTAVSFLCLLQRQFYGMNRLLSLSILLIAVFCSAAPDKKLMPYSTSVGTYGYKSPDKPETWEVFPMFKHVTPFDETGEYAMVTLDGFSWAIINRYGILLSDFVYPGRVEWSDSGLGVCRYGTKEYRLINLRGETLLSKTVPMKVVGSRLAVRYNDDYYTLVDYDLNPVSIERFRTLDQKKMTVGGRTVTFIRADLATRGTSILDGEGETISHFDAIEDAGLKNLLPSESREYAQMMFAANRYGKWGIVSLTGKTIVPFNYKSKDKLLSSLGRHVGKEIRNYISTSAGPDFEAVALRLESAEKDAADKVKAMYPDLPSGVTGLPSVYTYVSEVRSNGRSYLSATGKPSGEPFAEVKSAGYFWIVTRKDGKKYLYNCYGLQMSEKGYKSIETHGYNHEDLPYFQISSGKYLGLMDFTGNIVLEPSFDKLDYISDKEKLIFGTRDGKYYVIDGQSGRLMSNVAYDGRAYGRSKDGKYRVRRGEFELTLNDKGMEDPSLEEQLFTQAYNMPDNPFMEKVEAYLKCIGNCDPTQTRICGMCCNNIGVLYDNNGDVESAKRWFRKGAGFGNSVAKNNLALKETPVQQNGGDSGSGSGFGEILEGLSNIAAAFANGSSVNYGSYGGYGGGYGSSSYGGGDGGESYSGSSSGKSGRDISYYQNMYDRWNREAESCYRGLTRAGTRTKQGGKYTSGTAEGGWRPQNYVGLKQNLRNAQREMKRIRHEAKRDGYDLPKSNYETITVTD